ncbi:MAG: serine hydrolase [Porticoccaceae bacterium]
MLSPPMAFPPGEQFVYNSGITILLSHILQKSVDMPVDEYAQKYLFEPLGIKDFYWKKTPRGLTDAESGLYLTSNRLHETWAALPRQWELERRSDST